MPNVKVNIPEKRNAMSEIALWIAYGRNGCRGAIALYHAEVVTPPLYVIVFTLDSAALNAMELTS